MLFKLWLQKFIYFYGSTILVYNIINLMNCVNGMVYKYITVSAIQKIVYARQKLVYSSQFSEELTQVFSCISSKNSFFLAGTINQLYYYLKTCFLHLVCCLLLLIVGLDGLY